MDLGRAAALLLGFQQQRPRQLDQFGGRKGFNPEGDHQAQVLRLSISHAAQHDYGKRNLHRTNLAHQLGAVAPGHQMIGDDQANSVGQGPERGKCTLGSCGDENLKSCLPQDRLADLQLQRVVVDEENRPQSLVVSVSQGRG